MTSKRQLRLIDVVQWIGFMLFSVAVIGIYICVSLFIMGAIVIAAIKFAHLISGLF
jgi:hypothetical protein